MPARSLKSVKTHADIIAARALLDIEITGLMTLQKNLDQTFVAAVDCIHAMRQNKRGRLIVSGIGKSGHIARKMVATFASTGVPSYFVHPAEASHGDLGMITQDDVVILISVSGESREQGDLIAYTKRFDIPLIAITRVTTSTLAKAADILLLLPNTPEAFSDVVAPTTSAMTTLAFGDCLAEGLMKRAGITSDQFKVFHPGGKLGQQLLKVSDLMVKGTALPLVSATATMDKVIVMMTQKNVGCVLVVDKAQKLQGIVTDGDLKRHMGPKILTQKVSAIMSKNPFTIAGDLFAAEGLSRMLKHPGGPITSLVVVDKSNKVQGLLRVQECLAAGLV